MARYSLYSRQEPSCTVNVPIAFHFVPSCLRVALLIFCVALCVVSPAGAADFPSRPIRLVVPFPPGGVTDPVARVVGEHVAHALGQPVVIDNRPGGAGIIGAKIVKDATLKVYPGAPHGITDTHKAQLNEDLLAFIRG